MIQSALLLPLLLQPLGWPKFGSFVHQGEPLRTDLANHNEPAGVQARLDQFVALAPGFAQKLTLGASLGGKLFSALELAEDDLPPGSPTLLLVAGLEGPRVFDTRFALDHIARLIEGRGSDEQIVALLDRWRIVVVPQVALDAASLRLESPLLVRYGLSLIHI